MPQKPKWPWITLVILQSLQLLTLLPWSLMSGLAVMAFDAPGSEKMWQPWTFMLTIWSYPLWLLLVGASAWVFFAYRRYWAAIILCGAVTFYLPIALVLLLVILQ